MNTVLAENNELPIPGVLSFGIIGFAYALAVYRIPGFLVGSYLSSTGIDKLSAASIFTQFVVGAFVSVIAYNTVDSKPLKTGMRVFYGLIATILFGIGGYTLLASSWAAF
jgi:uncharacterized membrane protein